MPTYSAAKGGTAGRIFVTRGLRAVADGLVAATLSKYLLSRGMSETQVGVLITATLLGSAAVVLTIARNPARFDVGRVLRWCCIAMALTGALFSVTSAFPLLLVIALLGPLNPSNGDVSAFLPSEQALLPSLVSEDRRTHVFARYNLVGFGAGALGTALAGVPLTIGRAQGWSTTRSLSLVFVAYALVGCVCWFLYAPFVDGRRARVAAEPLSRSKRVVQELTVLFALDSAGGGLVLFSLIALWLDRRFGFSVGRIGLVLSAMGLLSAASSLLAPALAKRIGLVRVMVFTHLPANVFLLAAAFAPTPQFAVALLLVRALLSQMDVPARQSFVMSVVTAPERAAAAAYTNVPRSLAAATTPALAGWMLDHSTFAWHLVLGALLKIIYDLALLARFGRRR